MPSAPPFSLDQPLPAELAGSGHGWFTAYRRYPVFSPTWARGRARVFGLGAVLAMLAVFVPLALAVEDEFPLGGMVHIGAQLLLPLLLGPWLGMQVRRRGLPPPQEGAALAAAMALVVALMLAFHGWAAEPLKQALAEATGRVDEHGQRRKVVMSIGVSVATPEDPMQRPASAAANASPHASRPAGPAGGAGDTSLTNTLSIMALSFWLGGGAGLWGWRRERAGLAALAQARELAAAQASRREAEMRLSVLAAQVEPHFLFNTLAGVRSAIATDPARASVMIDQLVDYLRAAIPRLRASGEAPATLGEQLDIVRAYLGLMAARMPRLQWQASVADELLALPCPPLMLISLAENAVKHGVEPKIGPAHIEISARREGDLLEVTVTDDGAGFGASAGGSGLGLANIRERLQQMFGARAALRLKARPEGGVAATLSLPLE
jgi:signal transduction histidine kinase